MTRLMLWLFLLAVFLIFGGILAQLMLTDPGVLLISWQEWVVETTLWGAAGILLTALCFWLLLAALWRRFAPTAILSQYRNRRDRKAAKKETAIAIESWLKGDDQRAITALGRVAAAGGSDRLPSAIALALGLEQSDWLERYGNFISEDSELKLFADVLLAERLWQQQKADDFIDLLLGQFQLRQIPWLRERLWQAMLEAQRGVELVKLVNEAANIQPDHRSQWLIRAAVQALNAAQQNPEQGRNILRNLSKAQRNLTEVMVAEVNYLVSVGDHELAFKKAKSLLSLPVNNDQAGLLVDIQVDNLQKITFLERLQPSSPSAQYNAALGRLNMQQQLWGNAQSLLEKAWQQGSAAAGLHLAELFELRNMKDQSARLYKQIAQQAL